MLDTKKPHDVIRREGNTPTERLGDCLRVLLEKYNNHPFILDTRKPHDVLHREGNPPNDSLWILVDKFYYNPFVLDIERETHRTNVGWHSPASGGEAHYPGLLP